MFQSPLYYLVGALLVKVLSLFMSAASAMRWLVLINLGCGLAQIEICSRALKAVFPDRPVARSMGMLAGCLLPMNVYFSHYVGNQAFEGVLHCAGADADRRSLWRPSEWASGKRLTLIGAVIGLALLAKVNAVVPAALIVAALMIRSVIDQRSAWLTGEDLFFLVSPILVLAGWYYFRNWLNFGRPFLGGWGADAAFKWWQDRGFNTPRDLWTFGMGIVHPVYAGFGSLWDGFYSSMWLDAHLGGGDFENRPALERRFMVSSALVGIVPTLGMLIGRRDPVCASPRGPAGAAVRFGDFVRADGRLHRVQPEESVLRFAEGVLRDRRTAVLCDPGRAWAGGADETEMAPTGDCRSHCVRADLEPRVVLHRAVGRTISWLRRASSSR